MCGTQNDQIVGVNATCSWLDGYRQQSYKAKIDMLHHGVGSNRVTLIELIVLLAMISIGALLARALYPIGGLWLSILRFIAGVALIPSIFLAHNRYRRWAYRGDKWMPECSCGTFETLRLD